VLAKYLGRWPIALLACFAIGAAVLLPALGAPGLWEPQERNLSDRLAPPIPIAQERAKLEREAEARRAQQPPAPEPTCRRAPPDEPVARSLTKRALIWGRDTVGDTDAGRRLPLALLGLLTVLATAGIAIRTAGARAGIVTAIVLVAMPLLVLQSRMLTSEIGTACGAALIVYGLLAMGRAGDLVRVLRGRGPGRGRAFGLVAIDTLVGIAAFAAGVVLGFVAGGALLGLVVPIGAIAAAGKLGVPFVADVVRATRNAGIALARRVQPRWAIGRTPWTYRGAGHGVAFVATVLAIGLVGLLAYQTYDIRDPHPGILPPARQLFGHAIVPEGCWSWALGAVWRPEDDLRYIFDSSFEQIAYGTFPWGILGPVAMLLLVRDADPRRRVVGALALAWAAGAWIALEAFQRKSGVAIYSGFPAIALAVGVWLDGLWAAWSSRGDDRRDAGDGLPAGAILLVLFLLLAVLDLGKDVQSFPDKLASLVVSGETVTYPMQARLLFLPAKLWVLALGMLAALGVATAIVATHLRAPQPRIARLGLAGALGTSLVIGAFWAFGWQPTLATHLSSKAMFDTYRELRGPDDPVVIMGDLGQAPLAYAGTTPEKAATREQVVTALKRPGRVFAIAPQSELCALHRELGDKPYFVVDDRNTRNLLLSNRVDGTTDKNPLASMIAHQEPKQIRFRPPGRIVWDNKIELLGWDMPARVSRGDRFEVTTYYKILAPVGGNWTMIMHFDGAIRFSGDHKPIQDRCPTSTWQPGDYIIDKTTVVAGSGGHPLGPYQLWLGFFTGTAPNYRNMPVSTAPGDLRDTNDRVKITKVILD